MTADPRQELALLLLAGGLGTRFGGPKQIDPVGPGGTTLIDFAVADALGAGVERIVVVAGRDVGDSIQRHLEATLAGRAPLVGVEQPAPLGTGHAVWCARHVLPGSFLVANADDHYGPAAYRAMVRRWASLRASVVDEADKHDGAESALPAWGVAGYRLADVLSERGPVNRALCRTDQRGYLTDLVELEGLARRGDREVSGRSDDGGEWTLSGEERVSMNLWAFDPAVFVLLEEELAHHSAGGGQEHKEFRLPDAIRRGLREGRCTVWMEEVEGEHFGLTHPGDRAHVAARLAERGPPWPGERSGSARDPETGEAPCD